MKKVVTGHDDAGKSVFLEVGEADHVVNAPGILWREIWATHPDTTVPLKLDYKPQMQSRWKPVTLLFKTEHGMPGITPASARLPGF